MRKLLLLALGLFLFHTGHAQEADITGFWGLKFGESHGSVLMKVQDKCSDEQILVEDNSILMADVDFGGVNFSRALLVFKNNKLYGGYFSLTELTEEESFDVFFSLTQPLKEKYGDREPAVVGDAIQCMWGHPASRFITVALSMVNDIYRVMLIYNDGVIEKEEEKNILDDF